MSLPPVHEIAQLIDHAILRPNFTREDVTRGLQLAADYNIFSVCVRPSDVEYAKTFFANAGSSVKVGTVVGFPHGVSTTETKAYETWDAAVNGADEIDMVINISKAKDHDWGYIHDDISEVVITANEAGIEKVKVILETAYLTEEEIIEVSKISEQAGAHFVKTSTGFADEGATEPNLKLMRAAVSDHIEVKASGGVTSLEILLSMRALGVSRFGTSATKTILDDLEKQLTTGEKSSEVYAGKY